MKGTITITDERVRVEFPGDGHDPRAALYRFASACEAVGYPTRGTLAAEGARDPARFTFEPHEPVERDRLVAWLDLGARVAGVSLDLAERPRLVAVPPPPEEPANANGCEGGRCVAAEEVCAKHCDACRPGEPCRAHAKP